MSQELQSMRRVRFLLVSTIVASAFVGLVAGGAAHAQTETTVQAPEAPAPEGEGGAEPEGEGTLGPDEQECLELLEGGGSIEDCPEQPSPILPQLNELVWAVILFGLVAIFMMTFAAPRLRSIVEAREAKVRGDLEGAEQARTQAVTVVAEYDKAVAAARAEATAILEQARAEADAVRRDLMASAEADAAAERERAATAVRASTEQAMTELRAPIAAMSVELASKVVERTVDAAASQGVVDEYLSRSV
jgi:F-type H+-transporting ATPase subunit b